jgi:O-antigen ligase
LQARLRRAAVFGLVGASAMVMDPFGIQAFLLARLLVASSALLLAGVLMWKLGVVLLKSRLVGGAGLALLAALLTSGLVSRAPAVALLGASGRQLGVMAWFMFAVAFMVGGSLYEPTEGRRLLRVLVVSFAVAILWVGLVALFEVAGRPLVTPSQSFGGRVQGTFGNPAVLGSFLALALPIVVMGVVERVGAWLAVPAAVMGLWLLVVSGTRGAWLGIGAGVAFVALSLARPGNSRQRLRRTVIASAAVAAVLGLGALTLLTGRWGSAGAGIEGRVATWGVGVRVVAANPWLGVGPEGFATAFAETVGDHFVIAYTRDQVNDRAHNGLLDLVITTGLAGLVPYVVVIGGVLFLLVRSGKGGGQYGGLTLGVGAAVVAYLVQQQAFFQLPVIDLSFWFLVGILANQLGFVRPVGRHRVLAALAIVVSGLSVVYGILGVAADHADRQAFGAGSTARSLDYLEAAARLRPVDSIHPLLAAALLKGEEAPDQLDRVLCLHDRALRWDRDDGVLIVSKAGLLVSRYEATGDTAALGEAEVMLRGLIERDHTNGEALLRIGAIRYYVGDFAQARAFWLEAARLMPNRQEPLDDLAALP